MYLLTKVLTLKHFKTALREILCAQNGLWICGDQGVKVMINTHYILSYITSLFLSLLPPCYATLPVNLPS